MWFIILPLSLNASLYVNFHDFNIYYYAGLDAGWLYFFICVQNIHSTIVMLKALNLHLQINLRLW